jgi:hypothetical protein
MEGDWDTPVSNAIQQAKRAYLSQVTGILIPWVEGIEEKRKSVERTRAIPLMKQFDMPDEIVRDPMAALKRDSSLDTEQSRYAHLESFFKGLEDLDDIRNNSNEFVVSQTVTPKPVSRDKKKAPRAVVVVPEPAESSNSEESVSDPPISKRQVEVRPTPVEPEVRIIAPLKLPSAEDDVESGHWSEDQQPEPVPKKVPSKKHKSRSKKEKPPQKKEEKVQKADDQPTATIFRPRSLVSPFTLPDSVDSDDNFGGVV